MIRARIAAVVIAGACAVAVPVTSWADKPVTELACMVTVDYRFTSQDGTVLNQLPYQTDFLVQPGVDFTDDLSTQTRARVFTASANFDTRDLLVDITYFADVSTFDLVDLRTRLTIPGGRGSATTSGRHIFSTSRADLSGHHITDYSLTCTRI